MKIINPLKPIYNKNPKILILDSFPSLISRDTNFYYANKNYRFWKIFELIFNIKLNTIEDKILFLTKNNIALWDVIYSCEIKNSNDNSIKNVRLNNISKVINESAISHIFLTGKIALHYYNKYIKDSINITPIYLPSTSNANARYTLNDLVEIYKKILFYL